METRKPLDWPDVVINYYEKKKIKLLNNNEYLLEK